MSKKCLILLLIILVFSRCHKDDSSPADNKYLVNYKLENLFLLQNLLSLFAPLEAEYPEAAGIREHADYSVQVFSISYKTHYKGAEINASGLVCVPLASEKFPVVSFQIGTITSHTDAPTINPLDFNYSLLEAMASNGYVVLIPDNIGFGASSDQVHPYYQKETMYTELIDMIKAGNELMQDKSVIAKGNGDYYLMGYSQGGWATLSLLEELENSGQTDITVSAASCGAGAYDLMAMANYVVGLNTFPGPLYLPYFVYSEQVYGALTDPLDKFFNEPYAGRIPELFNGTYTNNAVNAGLNDTISRLLTTDLIENLSTGSEFQTLRDVLSENSVTAWPVKSLLRFYHGTEDKNVPHEQSQAIYDNFISAGSDPSRVQLLDLSGLTHESGVIPWGIKTINWFNELRQ